MIGAPRSVIYARKGREVIMKKVLGLIMSVVMVMSFAGCGKSASGTAQAGVLVMATNAEFPPLRVS